MGCGPAQQEAVRETGLSRYALVPADPGVSISDLSSTSWLPSGVLHNLQDPRVVAARRALGRLTYPVLRQQDLPSPSKLWVGLLDRLLAPADFPLLTLASSLMLLEERLRRRPASPAQTGAVALNAAFDAVLDDHQSVKPVSLVGTDPVSVAALKVYRRIRSRGARAGWDRRRSRAVAWQRAIFFHGRCSRRLPRSGLGGVGHTAALHAWAQCFARECVDKKQCRGGDCCSPSVSCDDAARIALRLAARLGVVDG